MITKVELIQEYIYIFIWIGIPMRLKKKGSFEDEIVLQFGVN